MQLSNTFSTPCPNRETQENGKTPVLVDNAGERRGGERVCVGERV